MTDKITDILQTSPLFSKAEYDLLVAENLKMLALLTEINSKNTEHLDDIENGSYARIPLEIISKINIHLTYEQGASNTLAATHSLLRKAGAKALKDFASHFDANDEAENISEASIHFAAEAYADQLLGNL